ncbi:MAG: hypothetical protein LBB23_01880 [Rickettsiales bacterium]|nr:hypothetical protein [Rickettsiales bacterium]
MAGNSTTPSAEGGHPFASEGEFREIELADVMQYIQNIKKSSPAYLRWTLLGIAAMLLLIFAVVILPRAGGKGGGLGASNSIIKATPSDISIASVSGQEVKESIVISSEQEIAIHGVSLESKDSSLTMTNTCAGLQRIAAGIPCNVNLIWKPAKGAKSGNAKIIIAHSDVGAPAEAAKKFVVPIALRVKSEESKVKSENVESVKATDESNHPGGNAATPPPLAGNSSEPAAPIVSEQSEIPAFAGMTDAEEVVSSPAVAEPIQLGGGTSNHPGGDAATPPPLAGNLEDDYSFDSAVEDCYKYAFVGYNLSGQQAFFIRPDNGTFKAHPFADNDCQKPTGEYNIETGFIYDLRDKNKKIGSDAEHVNSTRGAIRSKGGIPQLSGSGSVPRAVNKARQLETADLGGLQIGSAGRPFEKPKEQSVLKPLSADNNDAIISTATTFNRKFVMRAFKSIPATIVSDIRVDARIHELPVRAVVDRNVFSDSERNIIIPTGTVIYGFVTGSEYPGPYKTIGRIQVEWYQMIRPDGVEFYLPNKSVYSADAQGRMGIPGRGSTDYLEQIVMPMAASLVPAAVNLVAPISDKFVNQIDLNNNTVTQSGQLRSSELAKQEIIKSWDKVTQKLFVDMMDNMTPPFTIPAGTRITVLSNKDIIVNWSNIDQTAGLTPTSYRGRKDFNLDDATAMATTLKGKASDPDWVGQVRGTNVNPATGKIEYNANSPFLREFLDKSSMYESQYVAQQKAYQQQQNAQAAGNNLDAHGNNKYLGLQYDAAGNIMKPGTAPAAALPTLEQQIFSNPNQPESAAAFGAGLTCDDGSQTDAFGCCPSVGEQYVKEADGSEICCVNLNKGDEETCFPPLK